MVKKSKLYKGANCLYAQVKESGLSFMGLKKIQILSHEDEIKNHVESLNAIEKSNEYVEHGMAKIFIQFSIKKKLKNIR